MCDKVLPPSKAKETLKQERYDSLDGLRAYAAIGIVLMHVLANIATKPTANYLTTKLIPFFTDFTLLFMVVSGFSLCCGYYERIKTGAITPNAFYKKRYLRILPFFALLCLLDLALSPSLGSLCEVFANLTLCFGLLPSTADITVIGVGWFLGVVFFFYLLFPFFVFLMDNRIRTWISFGLAIVFVLVALTHFEPINRKNMIFCAPLFMAGGLAYIYRGNIFDWARKNAIVSAIVTIVLTVAYLAFRHLIPGGFIHYVAELTLFSLWLLYAIGSKDVVFNNIVVKYLSGISMEIYLCHMVMYRVVERVHIENVITNINLLYVTTSLLTILGAICFAHIVKYYVVEKIMARIGL